MYLVTYFWNIFLIWAVLVLHTAWLCGQLAKQHSRKGNRRGNKDVSAQRRQKPVLPTSSSCPCLLLLLHSSPWRAGRRRSACTPSRRCSRGPAAFEPRCPYRTEAECRRTLTASTRAGWAGGASSGCYHGGRSEERRGKGHEKRRNKERRQGKERKTERRGDDERGVDETKRGRRIGNKNRRGAWERRRREEKTGKWEEE